ncbi:cyclodeaminase/cyclohydrolase family protein [Pseudothermotoga thermarum]|uniref:Formiminotransferase-cyclodeaminase n=1 Tax=Pseudothermotoga thermarum DSM 5069 TaxID=688269 RepID=F7YY93_9THEM|nr:cyclodeaminase/cyclohydrolase family protein [Pseudothermotoga thermarum]AEH50914.1 Formiminotransferase-cyclodeaminase [Pseudothermotoga thermarum DSM 5069]
MAWDKLSLREFIEKVADKNPTPGGGAVSALVCALAAALNEMVSNLTLARNDYSDWHAEMERTLENMKEIRLKMLEHIELDIKAFDEVIEAYKMPKETEEQKEARKTAIQEALKKAAKVPYEVCRYSREVLRFAEIVARWGNINAISDAVSAAELAFGAFQAAKANVLINLNSIKDEQFVEYMKHELRTLTGEAEGALKAVKEVAKERGKLGL